VNCLGTIWSGDESAAPTQINFGQVIDGVNASSLSGFVPFGGRAVQVHATAASGRDHEREAEIGLAKAAEQMKKTATSIQRQITSYKPERSNGGRRPQNSQ
jgi:hypothetical protein